MPLDPGTRFGPYEIVAPLGAGGMGEVYQARDTRLDRTVAVKVLPSHIAQREDLRARFEREARAVSSLKHPNICSLYDVGNQDGVEYMVMEHLEGETLADRIARGPLPLNEALKFAMQIAEAVDRAHRSGVVHRDLKPANVMITRDGAKVLDFGLAKTAPKAAAAAQDATLTHALTSEGTVLGTPQYMSPEQIEGREADARTDIFAFGCLLYESVTGKRAFDGKTKASVIGAILSAEPPSMIGIAPPRLDTIVRDCLAKDPDERYQSLWDVLLDLRSLPEKPAVAEKAPKTWGPWAVVALFGLATLSIATVHFRESAPRLETVRFQIDPPNGGSGTPVISPDGRSLAMVAARKLWVRQLGSVEFQAIDGVANPTYPFWSPDSTAIAFFADEKLKKVVLGGGITTLCDAPFGRGGTWNRDGVILFAIAAPSGIQRVPASGGAPTAATTLASTDAEEGHRYPSFLPDGRHFLYGYLSANPAKAGLYLASLDGGEPVRLRSDSSHGIYASVLGQKQAHIVFSRGRTLLAQPFDEGSMTASGEAISLSEQLHGGGNTGAGAFSVSENGTLAHWSGPRDRQDLAWFDRAGKRIGIVVERTAADAFSFSPDGKLLAVGHRGDHSTAVDIWLHDRNGGASRFTFGPPPGWSMPVWSPDGRQLAYSSLQIPGLPKYEIRRKSRDMKGQEEVLVSTNSLLALYEWSRDGKWLLYGTEGDLWLLPLQPPGKPAPFARTPAEELPGQISPDGRWLAYISNESGRPEVYVQPIPPTGAKWQVSVNGGGWPRWRGDGKELFFTSYLTLMAVQIRLGNGTLEHSAPHVLFTTSETTQGFAFRYRYEPAPDGQSFLFRVPAAGEKPSPITVVLNWSVELRK